MAFYHCISRVAGRHFLFGHPEKERFVDFLRRYELFTGVRAVTFCVMDNHFHLLLEVPKRPEVPLTDEELTERIAALEGRLGASEVQQALENLRSIGAYDAAEALRESYFVRMWDLSAFMKGLKQAVLAAKGKLSRPELVRCRVRYFVDGCVIRSKAFVDEVFITRRAHFSARRTSGARLMRATAPPLYVMRDLQQNVLS